MALKKLLEYRYLFTILDNSTLRLRKAILKYGADREFVIIISKLFRNLTEDNAQLPEVVKRKTKENRSLARALAASKKRKRF